MRHRAQGRHVIFTPHNGAQTIVATTGHPDWAERIAQALNDTDPFPKEA
ncbi:hypothetical protein KIY87_gp24 [Mycobacterium phage Malec]|uniref:Uncharacterized protein n=1 Tax=Mycobacterium phage Malec TaxID=2500574 RepID=A0A3Q9R8Y0_9CAUD|nr:hypothetical protein KIY87_gp24 [Mycobacterium phage Malec]AZV00871.1 hypothetical protein SEA_MALEC_77 [Mycobacterium phage Malec]